MNATTYLRQLLASWPLTTVGTDEDINGGDVVEWLGILQAEIGAVLSGAELTRGNEEIRAAIRRATDTAFACGEWDRDESDRSFFDTYADSAAADSYLFALLGIPEDAPGSQVVHSPADLVRQARVHLRLAREALKEAGAPRAAERVRAALRSADGAQRHADLAPYREERQAGKAGI